MSSSEQHLRGKTRRASATQTQLSKPAAKGQLGAWRRWDRTAREPARRRASLKRARLAFQSCTRLREDDAACVFVHLAQLSGATGWYSRLCEMYTWGVSVDDGENWTALLWFLDSRWKVGVTDFLSALNGVLTSVLESDRCEKSVKVYWARTGTF